MRVTLILMLALAVAYVPHAAAFTMPPQDFAVLQVAEGGVWTIVCVGLATTDGELYQINDGVLFFTGWNRPRAVVGYTQNPADCPVFDRDEP